eukprot:UN09896
MRSELLLQLFQILCNPGIVPSS